MGDIGPPGEDGLEVSKSSVTTAISAISIGRNGRSRSSRKTGHSRSRGEFSKRTACDPFFIISLGSVRKAWTARPQRRYG